MVPAARSRIAAARPSRAACILSLLAVLPVLAIAVWMRPSFAADAPTAAPAAASTVAPAVAPPPAASAPAAAPKSEVKPTWSELTPAQREVLNPLASQWPQFDSNHKVKWLAIGNKYPSMTPEQQQRLKQHIADWAKLTPEQHRLARESYAKAKKLNPEQKNAQWQQYQQLPEEQKQKLAADAAAKKHIANVPSLQSKVKTVEPLRTPKKPAAQVAATPSGATPGIVKPGAAGAPPAPAATLPVSSGVVPVTNPQPATPAAPINK